MAGAAKFLLGLRDAYSLRLLLVRLTEGNRAYAKGRAGGDNGMYERPHGSVRASPRA